MMNFFILLTVLYSLPYSLFFTFFYCNIKMHRNIAIPTNIEEVIAKKYVNLNLLDMTSVMAGPGLVRPWQVPENMSMACPGQNGPRTVRGQ